MLKNASNFLKNQFKSHVTREDGCDTHGIDHGLLAPASLKTPKHYSCLETEQLDKLLKERGIRVKGNSILARIQALEAWDCQEEEEEEHGCNNGASTSSSTASDSTSSCKLKESDAGLDRLN
jgi:hypothetical protein